MYTMANKRYHNNNIIKPSTVKLRSLMHSKNSVSKRKYTYNSYHSSFPLNQVIDEWKCIFTRNLNKNK